MNEDDDADVEEVSDVQTLLMFTPLHVMSEWIELGTTKRCLTIAIVLPSGVSSRFIVLVDENGYNLLFTVMCLNPLLGLQLLNRKWLQSPNDCHMEKYLPKMIRIEQFLKQLRSCNANSNESTAIIPLLFQVQTYISSKYNLWRSNNSTEVVYVELPGYENPYWFGKGDSPFKICRLKPFSIGEKGQGREISFVNIFCLVIVIWS